MVLTKYFLNRLFYSIFVLIGVSILIFMITHIMPGDPARMALGGRAPERIVSELREEMHLNEPVYIQYYYWAKKAIKMDLGDSLTTRRAVFEDIRKFLPASLELALYTAFFIIVIGIFLGTISGWNSNSWIDNTVRIISYIGIITPNFVWAIFFMLIFGLKLNILPTIGRISPGLDYPHQITGLITIDALITGNFKLYIDSLSHIILPSLALAMGPLAQQARLTRVSICDNLQKDFIASARSYGINEKTIMFKYLLKPSLIPSISIFGATVATIIGGAFLIETIFNWPGLSRYGMTAILQKDVNAISGVVLVYGFLFISGNFLVDLFVGYLDPRISMRSST
jgi:peptide/nickel transport system permease protein